LKYSLGSNLVARSWSNHFGTATQTHPDMCFTYLLNTSQSNQVDNDNHHRVDTGLLTNTSSAEMPGKLC
jgi:hypothetical protein